MDVPRIEGERLVLEPVRPEHAERLRALRQAPEVARWWNPPPDGWPLEEEDGNLSKLAVVADGEVVGYVQYWEEPDPTGRHADVDIFLGPGAQGRGLGTEAMRMVTRHLIEERGHHRITLSTAVDNARAIHVYEKVGFRRVGVMRKASFRDLTGEWEDELLMELVVSTDSVAGVVLGVDVGGTKVAVAAVVGVDVRDSIERPTKVGSTAALLDGLEEAVRLLIGRVGQPDAIGVGVPSQIEYATGTVETSVNIPLTGVPLRAELGRRFGVPVVVDNDANCAALAEAHILGEEDLVMLTLGTGVGGGVVTRGMTFRGAHGLGAELGHFTLNPDGPPCPGNCPNRGCIEAYCSGQALERDATEMAADRPDSRLASCIGADGRVSGRELVAAAESGDRDALFIFENFARMLGIALAGYVNVFEPDRLAIGGGLSRASDLFLDRAVQEAQARALPALWRRTTIALAQGGAHAGAIGAAVLAAQELGGDTARPHATATERAE